MRTRKDGSPLVTYRLTAEHDELRAVVRELAEERVRAGARR